MKTITLNYDPATGTATDANGMHICGGMHGMVSVETSAEPLPLEKLMKLKEAGYGTDEIIRLRQEGLV